MYSKIAGLAQDRDDHHHPEQQEDDVPLDAALLVEEGASGVTDVQQQHQSGADERDLGAVHLVGDEEDIGADENSDGEDGIHRGSVSEGFGVGRGSTPTRLPGTPGTTLDGGPDGDGRASTVEGVKARDLAVPYPTVRMETDALTAARLLTEHNRPGLIVVDEQDHPIAVLPGSQVLRALIPDYVQDDPALARVLDEEFADPICDELAEHTVQELVPKDRPTLPVANDDDTVLEIAAMMAANRSPLVAVARREGQAGITAGRDQHPRPARAHPPGRAAGLTVPGAPYTCGVTRAAPVPPTRTGLVRQRPPDRPGAGRRPTPTRSASSTSTTRSSCWSSPCSARRPPTSGSTPSARPCSRPTPTPPAMAAADRETSSRSSGRSASSAPRPSRCSS